MNARAVPAQFRLNEEKIAAADSVQEKFSFMHTRFA
jgi:hypothetical protein